MIILLFVTAHWVLRINDNIMSCIGRSTIMVFIMWYSCLAGRWLNMCGILVWPAGG